MSVNQILALIMLPVLMPSMDSPVIVQMALKVSLVTLQISGFLMGIQPRFTLYQVLFVRSIMMNVRILPVRTEQSALISWLIMTAFVPMGLKEEIVKLNSMSVRVFHVRIMLLASTKLMDTGQYHILFLRICMILMLVSQGVDYQLCHFLFSCKCSPGFTGVECEIELDECASEPCQNEGICTDLISGYQCHCLPSFSGHNCEISKSLSKVLKHSVQNTPTLVQCCCLFFRTEFSF